ncbi:replication protein [Geobacillus stearothermophilus]|nr:replication protein [Geobacillus stearothermophilus]
MLIYSQFKKAMKEQNAILEVSKYPVKDTDVIKGNKVTAENVELTFRTLNKNSK